MKRIAWIVVYLTLGVAVLGVPVMCYRWYNHAGGKVPETAAPPTFWLEYLLHWPE